MSTILKHIGGSILFVLSMGIFVKVQVTEGLYVVESLVSGVLLAVGLGMMTRANVEDYLLKRGKRERNKQ